ncbi:MAG: acyl-CoA dehydrogenase family protein [Acidimicrobiales bacterium]
MTTTETAATGTETEEEFRARVNAFLSEHATGLDYETPDPRSANELEANKAFQQKLFDAGLAGLTYPKEHGGQGLSLAFEKAFREEVSKYPDMVTQLTISHGMCVPMLNEYAPEHLKAKYMPDAIAAKTVWCQMFSEPGAGSDVASLQTKAMLDGDEWIINGQKVWTTLGHVSDYGILIARTDVEVPKHKGITMFIVDMNDPAVEARAIHQIDGGMHFNEVFFTDLRVPKDHVLGDVNDGWRMATAMLMYERVAIGTGSSSGIKTPTFKMLKRKAEEAGVADQPVVRQALMKIYGEEVTKSLVSLQTRAALKAGKTPGPGGSLGKLHGARISVMTRAVLLAVEGASGIAWDPADGKGGDGAHFTLRSFAANIAGGTDEIQKNIIGDRVLGLPRDISVDRAVPFKELKVGTQSS